MDGWVMSEPDSRVQPIQTHTQGLGTRLQPIKFSKKRSKKVIPTIPEKWKKEFASLAVKPRTFKLTLLNPFITCPVCQGYLVDATTITECLHSFCRSCIVKHFESLKTNYTCPLCGELVHKTNPWYNLKTDCVLQDIVAKLVPGFTEAEERRRKVFYRSRGLPIPEKVVKPDIQTRVPSRPEQIRKETPSSRLVPSRSEQTPKETPSPQLSREQSREPSPQASGHEAANFDENDDHITMQLEMKSMDELILEDILPLKRKFVRCSNQVTVGLLQKFIAKKLNLEAANQIEIICNDMELGTDFTLHFIQETIADEEDHSKPLLLHYGLSDMA